jgi:hypothetical protein
MAQLPPTLKEGGIKVFCRVRPQNKLEIKEGGVDCIDAADSNTIKLLENAVVDNTHNQVRRIANKWPNMGFQRAPYA